MAKKENKVFVVLFFILIFVLLLILLSGQLFSKQIKESQLKSTAIKSKKTYIDWEELYPYDTVIDEIEVIDNSEETGSSITDKISNIMLKFGSLGNNWSREIYKYSDIAKIGYVITSKLTDPSIGNEYIRLRNGYWVTTNPSEILIDDAKKNVTSYASLNNYLKEQGIDFLYCYTPNKECVWDNKLPNGVISYANQKIDVHLQALDQYGIDYIDLRQSLHNDGLDHYSLFYKTDPHWNVDAGIWAASIIEKEISNRYGIIMENVYDFGDYKRTTYENAMFGPAGTAVTHYVEKSEDFDILYPEFDTNFRLEIPDKEIDTVGTFEELFVNYNALEFYMNQGGGYVYEQILYGNRPYEKITNMNNPNAPKVLMIRDSFSIAVAPYLSLSCSELVLIDTRWDTGNFNGSIINCINTFKPDIVLSVQSKPQPLILNKWW